jgi:hypothetical protein
MFDYDANDFADTEPLLHQATLNAYEQVLLLLVMVVAAVTMLSLLATLIGLLWQLRRPATTRPDKLSSTTNLTTRNLQPITRRLTMKRLALLITTLFLLTFAAQAQDRATTEGPVWSITEFRFKPNKRADYMKFVREHRVPVLMEWKRQGLIVDYKFYFNPTMGPQEPELVEAVLYRNFGERLDGDEARGKKFQDITLKHYGSEENRRKVFEELASLRELLRRYILREMTIHPLKAAGQ